MGLESANYIGDLNSAWPLGTDQKADGDNHIRAIKACLLNSFSGFSSAVLAGGAAAGSSNAYTLAISLPALGSNMIVVWKPNHTNTGAATLNINSLGAKAIKNIDGSDVTAGDLQANYWVTVVYDGTNFQMQSITKNYVDQLSFSSSLPAQAGNNGKYLTTNGTAASWASLVLVADPATHSGKYLTNNGSTTSWATITQATQGGFADVNTVSANTTLTSSNEGQLIVFEGSTASQTITLPTMSTMTTGYGFKIVNMATVSVTVSRGASDSIRVQGGSTATSLTLTPGASLYVVKGDTAAQWEAYGGTAQEDRSKQFALWTNEQTQGTNGGQAPGGSADTYYKNPLNTEKYNTITGASIASSVITLPAGTYKVQCEGPFSEGTGTLVWERYRFRNTSDNVTVAEGTISNGYYGVMPTVFTITASKNFEFQMSAYLTWTPANTDYGTASGFGTEVFSGVSIERLY